MMDEVRLFPATLMPDRDWWQALWPDPEGVLAAIGVAPGMRVVDLCCGDGHFTAPLCRLLGEGEAIGVELDEALLARARAACAACGNLTALRADARDLDALLPHPADLVFIANTFHGVPDKTALAAAVWRSLRPGGRLAVINWHRRPREETRVLGQPRGPDAGLRMTPEAVREVVEPAGFTLDRVVEVGPYHYAALFLRVTPPGGAGPAGGESGNGAI